MTSKEVTSPCSISDTRATLTPHSGGDLLLAQAQFLAGLGELVPAGLGEQPAGTSLDFLRGEPASVQLALQVLPVQGGALRHELLLLLDGVLQVQLRRYRAWYRHITLSMLAYAFLAVAARAATPGAPAEKGA